MQGIHSAIFDQCCMFIIFISGCIFPDREIAFLIFTFEIIVYNSPQISFRGVYNSRVGSSLLMNVKLSPLVTYSVREFIDVAVDLANSSRCCSGTCASPAVSLHPNHDGGGGKNNIEVDGRTGCGCGCRTLLAKIRSSFSDATMRESRVIINNGDNNNNNQKRPADVEQLHYLFDTRKYTGHWERCTRMMTDVAAAGFPPMHILPNKQL